MAGTIAYNGDKKMSEEKERTDWKGHYIDDSTLFKAVAFANHMISEGKPMSEALSKSSNYYKLSISEIAIELMVDKFITKNS